MPFASLEHVIRGVLETSYGSGFDIGYLLRKWREEYPDAWPDMLGSRPYWEAGLGHIDDTTFNALMAEATWLIDAERHDGTSTIVNLGTDGTALNATVSGARYLAYDSDPAFEFFGTAAGYISTTDKAALDLTGDFDLICRARLDDWTPSILVPLIAKFGVTDPNRAYYMRVNTDGTLGLLTRNATTTTINASTTAIGATDGAVMWLRVTRASASGAVNFYKAANQTAVPTAWTQIGTTVTGITGALNSGAENLFIGAVAGATVVAPAGTRIYNAIVKNGIGGSVVANMCAAEAPEFGTWLDGSLANTWTVTNPATGAQVALVDQDVWLFDGTDDLITVPSAGFNLAAGSNYTLFAVVASRNWPNSGPILLSKRSGAAEGWNLYAAVDGRGEFNFAPGGVADIALGPINSHGRMAAYGAAIDLAGANTTTVYEREVAGSANPVTDAVITNAADLTIGSLAGTPGNFAVWRLVAAGKFDRLLTASEWSMLYHRYSSKSGRARNAAVALTTPTYEGSGDAMHVAVWDFQTSWNGYRYWMANTPYPLGLDSFENPSILASADGTTWVVPAGGSNPIVPDPGGAAYNADTELVYDEANDRLVMYYGYYDGTTNKTVFETHSTDGITWSTPAAVIAAAPILTENPVSFSVRKTGPSEWTMWYVDTVPSPKTFRKRTSTTATGAFAGATTCTYSDAPYAGWDFWHPSVFVDDAGIYRCIMNTCTRGTNGQNGKLIVGSSTDGTTWVFNPRVVVDYGYAGSFDTGIYRSSGVQTGTRCKLWYSGTNGTDWATALSEFPMTAFPTP